MLSRLISQIFARMVRPAPPARQDTAAAAAAAVPAALETARLPPGASPAQWHQLAVRQVESGERQAAAACYLEAIQAHPDNAPFRVNASNVLKDLGRTAEAREHLEQAVMLAPDLAGAWYNLGILLHQTQYFDEALESFGHALRILRHSQDALLGQVIKSMGLSLQSAGRYLPARHFLHEMAEAYPRYASDCLRDALFTWVEDPDASLDEKLSAHRNWAAAHADHLLARPAMFANRADPERPLRIGYVSGDLRSHAVSYFFEPLLEHLNREKFSVFCYDNTANADATSMSLQKWPATWHKVASLDDDALARLIRSDGIDILVDLSGHTARNRLDAFARKPAPVQATWLGYPLTTGMLAMDYRITDATVDPPGMSEGGYSERLLRLPGSAWCFQRPRASPAVPSLPMLARGDVTYGSFNNIGKLNDTVLDTWAEVLTALPGARLLIARVPQGRCRDAFLDRWRHRGIDVARLELHGYLTRERFLALHDSVDIALDPFPCPGGTTSCESLWMGLPVLTLAGSAGLARAGSSILNAAGMPQWIAADRRDYVGLALKMAADPQGLAQIRASMRERLTASTLMNGAAFTRHFEAALRTAWCEWCAARQSGVREPPG